MLRRVTKRPVVRERTDVPVRDEVLATPELRDMILGFAIHEPRLGSKSVYRASWGKKKTYGRVSCVCKEWNSRVRSTPDNLRKILCDRSMYTGEAAKALAIASKKIMVYPWKEVLGVGGGKLFPMPATFDAVLRDHGGWAGVLARSKANAARALAAEKTRIANKKAKEEEKRHLAITTFHKAVARVAKVLENVKSLTEQLTEIAEDDEADRRKKEEFGAQIREQELDMAKHLQFVASFTLQAHGLE